MAETFAFQWHITDTCDQRCKHCYLFAEDCERPCMAMDRNSMRRVLDSAMGFCTHFHREPYFYITGGDPLLHPDFWELAERLHRMGVMWCVMGNPFHLDDDVCRHLKALGCRKYQLSLDGLRDTHDFFRKPGSFDSTLEVIPMLQRAGIWVAIMNTVSSRNAGELPDLIDLAAELGVDVFAFGRYCPTSTDKRDEYFIEPEDYRRLLIECRRRFDANIAAGSKTTFQKKDHLWTLLDYEQGTFAIPESNDPAMIYGGCHCGIGHLTVLPDGKVYACRRMESPVGNVFEDSLADIFLSPAMDAYRQFDRFEKCNGCELRGYCRGCPAVAAGSTGSMYAADPQCWKAVEK